MYIWGGRITYGSWSVSGKKLDDAIAFYIIKLGFQFQFSGENESNAERYAFFEYNGAWLELIEAEKRERHIKVISCTAVDSLSRFADGQSRFRVSPSFQFLFRERNT